MPDRYPTLYALTNDFLDAHPHWLREIEAIQEFAGGLTIGEDYALCQPIDVLLMPKKKDDNA